MPINNETKNSVLEVLQCDNRCINILHYRKTGSGPVKKVVWLPTTFVKIYWSFYRAIGAYMTFTPPLCLLVKTQFFSIVL